MRACVAAASQEGLCPEGCSCRRPTRSSANEVILESEQLPVVAKSNLFDLLPARTAALQRVVPISTLQDAIALEGIEKGRERSSGPPVSRSDGCERSRIAGGTIRRHRGFV